MPLILFCCILACISASVLFCSWRNHRKWSRRVVHLETYKGEVKADANDELPSSTSAHAWRSPVTLRRCKTAPWSEEATAAGAIASSGSEQSAVDMASSERVDTSVTPWESRWALLAMRVHELRMARWLKMRDALSVDRLAADVGAMHESVTQQLRALSPAADANIPTCESMALAPVTELASVPIPLTACNEAATSSVEPRPQSSLGDEAVEEIVLPFTTPPCESIDTEPAASVPIPLTACNEAATSSADPRPRSSLGDEAVEEIVLPVTTAPVRRKAPKFDAEQRGGVLNIMHVVLRCAKNTKGKPTTFGLTLERRIESGTNMTSVLIKAVDADSANVGVLQRGDELIAIGGVRVQGNYASVIELLTKYKPADGVDVEIVRKPYVPIAAPSAAAAEPSAAAAEPLAAAAPRFRRRIRAASFVSRMGEATEARKAPELSELSKLANTLQALQTLQRSPRRRAPHTPRGEASSDAASLKLATQEAAELEAAARVHGDAEATLEAMAEVAVAEAAAEAEIATAAEAAAAKAAAEATKVGGADAANATPKAAAAAAAEAEAEAATAAAAEEVVDVAVADDQNFADGMRQNDTDRDAIDADSNGKLDFGEAEAAAEADAAADAATAAAAAREEAGAVEFVEAAEAPHLPEAPEVPEVPLGVAAAAKATAFVAVPVPSSDLTTPPPDSGDAPAV